jgi:hypothetical protein
VIQRSGDKPVHRSPPSCISPPPPPSTHRASLWQAGQELELGITKDAEINLRGSGAAEEPVSDELLTAFATRLLQHKAVREEVTEAKSFVEKLKADNEKAERRAAKSARKAASKVCCGRSKLSKHGENRIQVRGNLVQFCASLDCFCAETGLVADNLKRHPTAMYVLRRSLARARDSLGNYIYFI